MLNFSDFIAEATLVRNQNVSSVVSRTDMPQFNDEFLDALLAAFTYDEFEIDVEGLKALKTVQPHIDMDKVNDIAQFDKPVVVSQDGYLVDGNHRAAAFVIRGDGKMPAIKIHADVVDILAWAKTE